MERRDPLLFDLYQQILMIAKVFPQPQRGEITRRAFTFLNRNRKASMQQLYIQLTGNKPVSGF